MPFLPLAKRAPVKHTPEGVSNKYRRDRQVPGAPAIGRTKPRFGVRRMAGHEV